MKVCSKCLKERDLSNFGKNNKMDDNLQKYCKDCRSREESTRRLTIDFVARCIMASRHDEAYIETYHKWQKTGFKNWARPVMKDKECMSRLDKFLSNPLTKRQLASFCSRNKLDKDDFIGIPAGLNDEGKKLFEYDKVKEYAILR